MASDQDYTALFNTRGLVTIPECLIVGTEFNKISNNKGCKLRLLKFDPALQRITWNSRKLGVIQLEWISCIKLGSNIEDFPITAPFDNLSNRLVIHYSHKSIDKRLNLIAPTEETANAWYLCLQGLMVNSSTSNSFKKTPRGIECLDRKLEQWLKQHWAVIDKNKDGKIDIKEFKTFLNLINYKSSEQDIKTLFKIVDLRNSNFLDFEATKQAYHFLQTRPEVQELFKSLAKENNGKILTEEEFSSFLTKQQKENYSSLQLKSLFNRYSQGNREGLTKDQFLYFLLSDDNPELIPLDDLPMDDMNQPLSHYWINSSHNTYLTGDQLKSASSIAMYKDSLLKGCRCVELDCWDGPKGEPIIYHGYTLTSKILFKDVIETVRDYAFTASPFPVILSLEIHCSIPQQDVMANHLKNILGDMLITSRLEDSNGDVELKLPSPNQLLRKILIKGKVLKDTQLPNSNNSSNDNHKSLSSPGLSKSYELDHLFTKSEEPSKDGNNSPTKNKKPKVKISQLLSDLIPYCQAVKFVDIAHANQNMKYYQMSSFAEVSLLDQLSKPLIKYRAVEFLLHNQKCMSRVYPDKMRIDSSNFNPLPFWLAGFQLVALNFQKQDLGMLMNNCFFRQNRHLGYVLKPHYMRQPMIEIPLPEPKKYYLHLKVISGQNLPKPDDEVSGEIIDPQVEIEMVTVEHGTVFSSGQNSKIETQEFCNMREELFNSSFSSNELSYTVVRKSLKSEVVEDNGFNPTWSMHAVFMFSNKEFNFLRFKVIEYNKRTSNSIIGQYCIRLADLKSGYRHIPIYNNVGVKYPFASLFILSTIETYPDPSVLERIKFPNLPSREPTISPVDEIASQAKLPSNVPPHEPSPSVFETSFHSKLSSNIPPHEPIISVDETSSHPKLPNIESISLNFDPSKILNEENSWPNSQSKLEMFDQMNPISDEPTSLMNI